ncbi:MAG: SCP2 sterol-binding domain-containing protein, partial [Myxococcales bacterium]|nr:SCP2 sterol-binding domain-containing protein [Myxococcales bacterium]
TLGPEEDSVSYPFPSETWTQAYAAAVNANEAYRKAGQPWTYGKVAMVVQADPSIGLDDAVSMILDVHEGRCNGAVYVKGLESVKDAPFVIVANYARWRDVIEGRLDPIKAMMEGKLKLTQGHLPTMIRFVESSRQLVVSAANVPTTFLA